MVPRTRRTVYFELISKKKARNRLNGEIELLEDELRFGNLPEENRGPILSHKQIASRWGVTNATVRRWFSEGLKEAKPHAKGGNWYAYEKDVEDFRGQ